MIDALILALGLGLLLLGGDWVVRGSTGLARRLGVSPLVVGMTILGFGTSAPELAVNITASVRGTGAVAFGNIAGSNVANVGLILGITAMLRPLAIHSTVLTREMPMMLLASSAALVMGFDGLRGLPTSDYDRPEGLLLLLLFVVFLYYTFGDAVRGRAADPLAEQSERHTAGAASGLLVSGALVTLGIVALVLGGRSTVSGAVAIASDLGVPEGIIGLTVVAVGTSLPELSASISAALKGEPDLAVGNVVGSNIFNLIFILGLTATARPVPVPPGGHWDLLAMVLFAAVLLPFAFTRREISRTEGALLMAGYLVFVVMRAA